MIQSYTVLATKELATEELEQGWDAGRYLAFMGTEFNPKHPNNDNNH